MPNLLLHLADTFVSKKYDKRILSGAHSKLFSYKGKLILDIVSDFEMNKFYNSRPNLIRFIVRVKGLLSRENAVTT